MLFLLFFYFLFSSSALADRRVLHEPFFPVDSPPPSPPQSPPLPKLPFSSTTPPDATSPPFFPTYPSPPPPPSPASFASFPANISSLIVPHATKSPPSSKKLLIAAISAVTSAALVAALIALLYWRRRRGRSSQESNAPDDSKTWTTDSSRRVYPPPPPTTAAPSARRNAEGRASKQRTTTTTARSSANTSSEFLYLGTMVNPRGVEDHQSVSNRSNNGSSSRKLESPDLQPLPPLMKRSFRLNPEVGSIGEEDEEEFYSPRGSASGRETLTRVGSESRRVFSSVPNQNVRSVNNDTISCSSSSSGSPGRSTFISISPSMSPKRSEPKKTVISAPEPPPKTSPGSSESSPSKITDFRLVRSPSLSLASLSPRLCPGKIAEGGGLGQISRSPTVTSLTTSPERENKEENSLQNLDDDSPRSSSRSSASTSPERRPNDTPEAYLRSPVHSSASTSPYRCFQKSPEVLPAFMSNLRQGLQSQLLSSPGQGFLNELDALRSEKTSHKSPPEKGSHDPQSASSSSLSSSPDRDFSHSLDVSPRISNISSQILQPPVSAARVQPPPPPPPPPPFPTWARRNQASSKASRPPPLTPPSNPFVIPSENLPKTSPEETHKETFSANEPAEETPKPKLKALHWDKVRASSDREMVWDQLRSSSFKLDEEMIETLFVAKSLDSKPNQSQTTPRCVLPSPNQENRVLDPKKAQNIAILLRALNVTIEEVCEALLEGNAETLGTELLESLLKMAPTKEEERKLKEYKDDSPVKLGHAEKFLKAMLDIPFAFKRVDAMLYVANFESEVEYLKNSFETLEAACEELRNSRMFLKLLEAVLKTGNRMNVGTNRGDAHAFKLDTLLKLVDVKGADGKTTLLHFVVQEIIRAEGTRLSGDNNTQTDDIKCRKLGLQVVSSLSSELSNVKKAAAMDSEVLSSYVSKLSQGIAKINEAIQIQSTVTEESGSSCSERFLESMNTFLKRAEEDIIRVQAQESVALSLVKEITEYFHGNSAKEEAHPFRIFLVVRDFLGVVDRVCKEVGMINERTMVSSAHKFPVPVNPMLPQPLPGLFGRKQSSSSSSSSSSDDEHNSSH
ncbi:hypothetical protein BRARA_C03999 [Brassica rapa]|uniref:Formin-like protein n=1 Tax=Brassica campestris TaxID=3711 RepID=A0A398A9Z4_BRACM|nr:hypothetical protein BRARA_C03999 [Brassica rapa]